MQRAGTFALAAAHPGQQRLGDMSGADVTEQTQQEPETAFGERVQETRGNDVVAVDASAEHGAGWDTEELSGEPRGSSADLEAIFL